ncbi:hypothetical protein AAVH_20626 [Aphelenchoides avenae]|nr:hypothetical protein AAVH_20626 [Aphelenchus avenae]
MGVKLICAVALVATVWLFAQPSYSLDCRSIVSYVNCSIHNCPLVCSKFGYTGGQCLTLATSCPGYSVGQKVCACTGVNCRNVISYVNCAIHNCPLVCKKFAFTGGVCAALPGPFACPGYAVGQKACYCS